MTGLIPVESGEKAGDETEGKSIAVRRVGSEYGSSIGGTEHCSGRYKERKGAGGDGGDGRGSGGGEWAQHLGMCGSRITCQMPGAAEKWRRKEENDLPRLPFSSAARQSRDHYQPRDSVKLLPTTLPSCLPSSTSLPRVYCNICVCICICHLDQRRGTRLNYDTDCRLS
jgi:hypothetical protein